jgi:2-polyprenyl-3-methyl-5-hydroxy-6-metoxy-1,4-benzoquinol methylase
LVLQDHRRELSAAMHTPLEVFDDDYLYFSDVYLTAERAERETALIAKLFELRPGMSVLDLGCGHGRIANRLAARGMRVTGVDANEKALRRARREAASMKVSVEYIEADIRALSYANKFDCVLSWYTSFGLFDDESNRQVLLRAHRALRPGGQLLIEHINRDLSLRNLQHAMVEERDGENFMIDFITFDAMTSRSIRTRKFSRDGRVKTTKYFIRLFTITELADWMRQAGFSNVRGYGKEGEPFSLSSERMIVLGAR